MNRTGKPETHRHQVLEVMSIFAIISGWSLQLYNVLYQIQDLEKHYRWWSLSLGI